MKKKRKRKRKKKNKGKNLDENNSNDVTSSEINNDKSQIYIILFIIIQI